MKKLKYLFTIFLMLYMQQRAIAYDNLLFKPLTANPLEARIGNIVEIDDEKLRLDIGASFDLAEFELSENSELRLGSDFMVYTRLRSEGKFKFPVETSDYFFGVNSSYKFQSKDYNILARVRLAHISSHFVDGLAQDTIFTKMPFVYSREFIDIVGALEIENLRIYAGANIIFSKIPRNSNVLEPQLGFDYKYNLSKLFSVLAGYDFKLIGQDNNYNGANAAQLGILINTSDKRGVLVSTYYYSGNSMHGMFLNYRDEYFGLGFQLYFE